MPEGNYTISNLVNGITFALKDVFPAISVYADKVPQNLELPALLVRQINMSLRRGFGLLYRKKIPRNRLQHVEPTFAVTYIPRTKEGGDESREALDKLLDTLDMVPAGDGFAVSARHLDGVISDGLAVVTATYPYSVLWTGGEEPMQNLKQRYGGNDG